MTRDEVLTDAIRNIDPESLPIDLVLEAHLEDEFGHVKTLAGLDLLSYYLSRHQYPGLELRIIPNDAAIRAVVMEEVAKVYAEVARRNEERLK